MYFSTCVMQKYCIGSVDSTAWKAGWQKMFACILWLQHNDEVKKTLEHCISKRQRFRAVITHTNHLMNHGQYNYCTSDRVVTILQIQDLIPKNVRTDCCDSHLDLCGLTDHCFESWWPPFTFSKCPLFHFFLHSSNLFRWQLFTKKKDHKVEWQKLENSNQWRAFVNVNISFQFPLHELK